MIIQKKMSLDSIRTAVGSAVGNVQTRLGYATDQSDHAPQDFNRNPDVQPDRLSEVKSAPENVGINLPEPTSAPDWWKNFVRLPKSREEYEKVNTTGANPEMTGETRTVAIAEKEALEKAREKIERNKIKANPNALSFPASQLLASDRTPLALADRSLPKVMEKIPGTAERVAAKYVRFDPLTNRKATDYRQSSEVIATKLYGADILKKVEEYSKENITAAGALAQGSVQLLNSLIEADVAPSPDSPLGGISNEKDVQVAMADTIKSVLVLYPEKAADLLKALSRKSPADLFALPNGLGDALRKSFQDRLMVGLLDKVASDARSDGVLDKDATYASGRPKNNPNTIARNRRRIIEAITDNGVAAKSVTLQARADTPAGVVGAAPAVGLTNLKTGAIATAALPVGGAALPAGFRRINDQPLAKEVFKADAKFNTVNQPRNTSRFSSYKSPNVLFKGLILPPHVLTNAGTISISKDLALAASKDPALLTEALNLGYDDFLLNRGALSEGQRAARLKDLREKYAANGVLTQDEQDNLLAFEKQIEINSKPDKVVEMVTAQLLEDTLMHLDAAFALPNGTIPELDALKNKSGREYQTLLWAINEIKGGNPITPNLMERLSTIMMGVQHDATRNAMADSLRSVTLLVAAKGLAEDVAKSNSGLAYDYTYYSLVERILGGIDNKSGVAGGTALTAEEAAKYLRDVLFSGKDGEKAKLVLQNPQYLAALRSKYAGATLPADVEITNQALTGHGASEYHKYMGTIRRGQEGAMLLKLRGQSDSVMQDYLEKAFTIKKTDKDAAAALGRLKEILADKSGDFSTLPRIVMAAASQIPLETNERYTNLIRVFEHYIRVGGDRKEILHNAELGAQNNFFDAMQEQANPVTGAPQGSIQTAAETTLSVEEQRLQFLEKYEDLGNKSTLGRIWGAIKGGASRAMKQMAIAFIPQAVVLGTTIAAAAGIAVSPWILPVASMAWIGYRLVGMARGGRALFEAGRKLQGDENKNAFGKYGSAALGAVLGAATMILMPTPLGIFASTIMDTVGLEVASMRALKKEHKILLDAHTAYDTAMKAKLNSIDLSKVEEKDLLERMAASMGVTIANRGAIDKNAVIAEILANRQKAQDGDKDMRIRLSQFSRIMEDTIKADAEKINKANLEAQKVNKRNLENMTAYSAAKSTVVLGMGALGMTGLIGGGAGFEGGKENGYERLENKLDAQLDEYMETNGYGKEADVVGITKLSDGITYAVVDLPGNEETADAFIEVSNTSIEDGKVTFSDSSSLQFNPTSVHLASTQVSDDGVLEVETLKQQYTLETGVPRDEFAIVDAKASDDASYQGYIVDSRGEMQILMTDETDNVGLYSPQTLLDSYETSFKDVDGKVLPVESTLIGTNEGDIIVGFTIEQDGKTQIVGLVDPRTGENLSEVTSIDGSTIKLDINAEIGSSTDTETATNGFVYNAVSGDSPERSFYNVLREVYPGISAEDEQDAWREVINNGKETELRSFLNGNPYSNAQYRENPGIGLGSAFDIGDSLPANAIAYLAPNSAAELNASYSGADVNLEYADSTLTEIYRESIPGFVEGPASPTGETGASSQGIFTYAQKPIDPNESLTGFPAPVEGNTLWFNQSDSTPVQEAPESQGFFEGVKGWFSNTWNSLTGGNTTTTGSQTQGAADGTTGGASDDGTSASASDDSTTQAGNTTRTFTFQQPGSITQTAPAGAESGGPAVVETQTRQYTFQAPTWGGTQPAEANVEYLPVNPLVADQIKTVTVVDMFNPGAGALEIPEDAKVLGFIPGAPGSPEGVIYQDSEGVVHRVFGDVAIKYANGNVGEIPTQSVVNNTDPLVDGTWGNTLGRAAANAQQRIDGVTSNLENIFGKNSVIDGPYWDLPGQMGDQPISPEYMKFIVSKPDGSEETYFRGQVMSVTPAGININVPNSDQTLFIPGKVIGLSEQDTDGDNVVDKVQKIDFSDVITKMPAPVGP